MAKIVHEVVELAMSREQLDLLVGKALEIPSIQISKKAAGVLSSMEQYGLENPGMRNVTRELGQVLYNLAVNRSARNIVEVGTSNGYSTIWLALAAQANGGRVTTIEKHEWKANMAKRNIAKADLSDTVKVVLGKAEEKLRDINRVDFLFMDILPEDYSTCMCELWPMMKHGSLVICDNLFSHRDGDGKVTLRGDEGNDYLQFIKENTADSSTILGIGSGIQISIL